MQSSYLCVILQIKRKKEIILTAFTWFLILNKIQDGDQDSTCLVTSQTSSSATNHNIYLIF